MAQDLRTEPPDQDERLGEAVEAYLALMETGNAPEPEAFVATQAEDLRDDLLEALEGLSLVRGLVGAPGGRKLEAGRRLAGYRIVGELGSGGMGTVYEAVHVDLDRPVALKVLDARALRPGSSGLQRFLNEAKTAASLHHTHIVPVFDVGHVGGLCYYAMQRIEGSGLDHVLRALRRGRSTGAGSSSGRPASLGAPSVDPGGLSRESLTAWTGPPTSASTRSGGLRRGRSAETPPPFEPPRGSAYYRWVAQVGRQAAQALDYAHQKGIIHRDVKPSNLLIDGSGSIWVADFGLARRATEPGLTQVESLIGTPRYMSPEQSRVQALDRRTDVYSLGATLYELLTLRPPFEGRSTAELFEQISQREPLAPRRIDARIPRDLETIVLKALAKRPGDRYAQAADVSDDLERFLQFEPVQARRIGPVGRLWRLAQRHPAVAAVSTVATAVVLAVATVAYVRVVQERDRAVSAEGRMQDVLREHMLSQAELVRISPVPDRRIQGLELLRDAAAMDPRPDQRARLRAEAIAYLSLRDVERRATWATRGRPLGLAFDPSGTRLATVSEDGRQVLIGNLAEGQPAGPPLLTGPAPAAQGEPGRSGGSGPPFAGFGPRIAAMGPQAVALWPDGRGFRQFELEHPETFVDRRTPGHELIAVYAVVTAAGPRVITLERPADDPSFPFTAPRDRFRDRPRLMMRALLWDPTRPERPLATLAEPDASTPEPGFLLVAPSSDGRRIATAWARGSVVSLFSATNGRPVFEIETHAAISSLALSPYGMMAAAGGGTVRLWDLSSQVLVSSVTPQQGDIRHLRFSPDGRLLALAGPGTDVEVWDPVAGELVAALPTTERVMGLAFAPDSRKLAIALPETVQSWAIVESDVQTRFSGLEGVPTALAFGPAGELAMSFWGELPARIWHPTDAPTTTPSLVAQRPASLAYDANGQLVALSGNRLEWFDRPARSSEPVRTLSLPTNEYRFPGALIRSRDGRTLLVYWQGQLHRWQIGCPDRLQQLRWGAMSDAEDEREPGPGSGPPARPPGPGAGPPPPGPPPDAESPKSGSRPQGERGSRGGSRPRGGWGTHLTLSPRGDRLYGLVWGGELAVWSLHPNSDRVSVLRWPVSIKEASALALSPDGSTLAVGQRDGGILLVNTATGQARSRIGPAMASGEAQEITSLTFGPEGAWIAAGSRQGTVAIRRLATPAAEGSLPTVLPGHRGAVLGLAVDPTGTRLATTGDDKTLILWKLDRLHSELTALSLDW